MRSLPITLSIAVGLALPAAASAREQAQAKPGYLVVRKAAGDGGVAQASQHQPEQDDGITSGWVPSPGGDRSHGSPYFPVSGSR